MKGFRAEPGERSASVMSMAPERSRFMKSGLPTWASTSPVPLSIDEDRRRELRVEALQTVAGETLRVRSAGEQSMVSRCTLAPGSRTAASAAWAAIAGKGRRPGGRGSALAATASADVRRPLAEATSSTRSRARRAASGIAVRPARLGRLRQRDEERGFGEGEPLRLAPEICEARGAGAFEIAAVRREREVEPQDLGLRQPPLQFDGPRDLAQFRAHAPLVPRLEEARHLHGQRRTARDDAALPQELCAGPGERPQVDAAMLLEAVILVGLQHGQEMRVDISRLDRQSPSPVRRGEGPEETAVAVEHDGRMVRSRGEIERSEAS